MTTGPLTARVHSLVLQPTQSLVVQVPRALVVSALAAGLDVLLYVLLVGQAGWPPVLAAALSYLLGGVVQYVLCCWWVFPQAPVGDTRLSVLAFLALSLVGLGITAGVIWLLNKELGVHYLLAKVLALGLAFCWNFGSRKYLIFKH